MLFSVKLHCGRKDALHSSKIAIQHPLFVVWVTSSQQCCQASLLGVQGRNIFGDGKSSILWSQIECSETFPGVEHLWNPLFLDKFFHHGCVALKHFTPSCGVFATRSWRSYVNSWSMIGVELDDYRVDFTGPSTNFSSPASRGCLPKSFILKLAHRLFWGGFSQVGFEGTQVIQVVTSIFCFLSIFWDPLVGSRN